MMTYTSGQLKSLKRDPPPKRKAVFSYQLWRQYKSHRPPLETTLTSPDQNGVRVSEGKPRLTVGWLNVWSLPGRSWTSIWIYWFWPLPDAICLRRSAPDKFFFIDAVRPSDSGHDGIAVIYQIESSIKRILLQPISTFERLGRRIKTSDNSWILLLVNRPGSVRPCTQFCDRLCTLFESFLLYDCPACHSSGWF